MDIRKEINECVERTCNDMNGIVGIIDNLDSMSRSMSQIIESKHKEALSSPNNN